MSAVLDRMRAEAQVRYDAETAKGEHDGQCEWRPRSWLCHCSKRRREAVGFTTPPELDWVPPACGRCGNDTNPTDGGFICETCHVYWDRNGDAEFTDDFGDLTTT